MAARGLLLISCVAVNRTMVAPAQIAGASLETMNETSGKCHTAQAGPFVFEHGAVKEGCTSCHNPHGSVNQKMRVARDTNLCRRCHLTRPPAGDAAAGQISTASPVAGAALTKTDDPQLRFTYDRADNDDPQLAPYTQPYGTGVNETVISAGLQHKFSDTWIGHARIGYDHHQHDTTGGRTNFRGPLAYVSIKYGL